MPGALKLIVTARQIPKMGLSAEQCEDAWAVAPSADRFAVADGASDSYASGRFARLLVEDFVGESGPRSSPEFAPWARGLASSWAESTPLAGLPWYKQEKARLGAHCTFVGVQLEAPLGSALQVAPDDGGETSSWGGRGTSSESEPNTERAVAYRAFAVGDACLFHVRDDRLIRSFPIESPKDFGVQPALIATSRAYGGPGVDRLVEVTGDLVSGDTLILATDAVAHYILASANEGRRPWQDLAEQSTEEFGALVTTQRAESHMRNDDATVVVVSAVGPKPPPGPEPEAPRPQVIVTTTAHRHRRGNRRRDRALAVSVGVGALLIAAALLRGTRPGAGMLDFTGNGLAWP